MNDGGKVRHRHLSLRHGCAPRPARPSERVLYFPAEQNQFGQDVRYLIHLIYELRRVLGNDLLLVIVDPGKGALAANVLAGFRKSLAHRLLHRVATCFHGGNDLLEVVCCLADGRPEIHRHVVRALGKRGAQITHASAFPKLSAAGIQKARDSNRHRNSLLSFAFDCPATEKRRRHGRIGISRGFVRFIHDDDRRVAFRHPFKKLLPVIPFVDLGVGREKHVVTGILPTNPHYPRDLRLLLFQVRSLDKDVSVLIHNRTKDLVSENERLGGRADRLQIPVHVTEQLGVRREEQAELIINVGIPEQRSSLPTFANAGLIANDLRFAGSLDLVESPRGSVHLLRSEPPVENFLFCQVQPVSKPFINVAAALAEGDQGIVDRVS